jgi:DNA (cytosine-5)-methyltransferase 1
VTDVDTYLSLFSGIGGLDLGLDRAGWRCVGQVEKDPFCRRVLAKHWPEVPRHDDVTTAVDWWRSRSRPAVRAVAGGFPCQPVSDAGPKLAQEDERWLWPEMAAVVDGIRPDWVIAENVPGLRRRGLAIVLRDLRRLGYRARAGYISACEMGATHPRKRMFILAHPEGKRRRPGRSDSGRAGTPDVQEQDQRGPRGCDWWATEPDVGRVAYGVPSGVDRLRGLGNAVVPQVGEYIGQLVRGADLAGVA